MSLDSPAEIVPFERFLEFRERLRRSAAAKGGVVVGEPTDLGLQPDVDKWANAVAAEPPAVESRVAGPAGPADPAVPRASRGAGRITLPLTY